MTQTLHYDCDPGQDDAIALLYALGSSSLQVSSLSTVGGNAYVENCTRNLLQLLEFTGNGHIPVFQGCGKPLFKKLVTLPQVFGESGMAGAEELPDPKLQKQATPAPDFLASEECPALIVATGPLTNLAVALQANPAMAQRIGHLVILGGCVRPDPIFNAIGNIASTGTATGLAEYNFATDPDAARIVFASGIRNISLIGLDIARPLLFNGRIRKRLEAIPTRTAALAARILSTVGQEDREEYRPFWEYPEDPVRAMYDVVAMAYAESPGMFETQTLPLRIDTTTIPGQTLIDALTPTHPAVTVISKVDESAFFEALCRNLARLP